MSGKILFDIDHRFNQKLLFIFYLIFNNLPFYEIAFILAKKDEFANNPAIFFLKKSPLRP